MDMITRFDPSDDPVEMLVVKQVAAALEQYSDAHKGRFCFEAHAYELFLARMADETNAEIATRLNISTSAVGQWLAKLRPLINTLLENGGSLVGNRTQTAFA